MRRFIAVGLILVLGLALASPSRSAAPSAVVYRLSGQFDVDLGRIPTVRGSGHLTLVLEDGVKPFLPRSGDITFSGRIITPSLDDFASNKQLRCAFWTAFLKNLQITWGDGTVSTADALMFFTVAGKFGFLQVDIVIRGGNFTLKGLYGYLMVTPGLIEHWCRPDPGGGATTGTF